MEPEGSLLHSQVPSTCPYPEPAWSNHYPHPTSWRSILISSHLHLGLPSGLFPSGFPIKTLNKPLFSPIRDTCPAHLILLDFISRTILDEEYRTLSPSLCSLWKTQKLKNKYRFAFRGLNRGCPYRSLLLTLIYTGSRIIQQFPQRLQNFLKVIHSFSRLVLR